jgi:hypothetical protein
MPRRPIGLRPLRQPKTRTVQLRDFSMRERLCFLSAWSPPKNEFDRGHSRWQTWADFVRDYEAVRTELLERHAERCSERPIFAERVLKFRDTYGMEELKAASYEDIRDF